MRLRRAVIAAFGAATLVLTVPTSASAAVGLFEYAYVGPDGHRHVSVLLDPAAAECHTLPQVADPEASEPAFSPRNFTNATATVFAEPDCQGDYFSLRPLTGRGSDRLKFRSVVFSS